MIGLIPMIAQEIISIEADGNLESPNPCGCIELSKVNNQHNPADILNGMAECIEQKEYKKAASLFAIAGVYGTYDMSRVKDGTAHQALLVLQQNIFFNMEESEQKQLMESLKKELEAGSENLNNVCQSIQKVGAPNYHPKYMIQHGIQAFIEDDGNGLVEEFNSEESWILALKTYLHCGE